MYGDGTSYSSLLSTAVTNRNGWTIGPFKRVYAAPPPPPEVFYTLPENAPERVQFTQSQPLTPPLPIYRAAAATTEKSRTPWNRPHRGTRDVYNTIPTRTTVFQTQTTPQIHTVYNNGIEQHRNIKEYAINGVSTTGTVQYSYPILNTTPNMVGNIAAPTMPVVEDKPRSITPIQALPPIPKIVPPPPPQEEDEPPDIELPDWPIKEMPTEKPAEGDWKLLHDPVLEQLPDKMLRYRHRGEVPSHYKQLESKMSPHSKLDHSGPVPVRKSMKYWHTLKILPSKVLDFTIIHKSVLDANGSIDEASDHEKHIYFTSLSWS